MRTRSRTHKPRKRAAEGHPLEKSGKTGARHPVGLRFLQERKVTGTDIPEAPHRHVLKESPKTSPTDQERRGDCSGRPSLELRVGSRSCEPVASSFRDRCREGRGGGLQGAVRLGGVPEGMPACSPSSQPPISGAAAGPGAPSPSSKPARGIQLCRLCVRKEQGMHTLASTPAAHTQPRGLPVRGPPPRPLRLKATVTAQAQPGA